MLSCAFLDPGGCFLRCLGASTLQTPARENQRKPSFAAHHQPRALRRQAAHHSHPGLHNANVREGAGGEVPGAAGDEM